MSVSDAEWRKLKLALPVGSDVHCEVKTRARFGFFVTVVDHPELNAVVLAPDFERRGKSVTSPEDFPPVGSQLTAEVLDHVDQTRQVRLKVGPHVRIDGDHSG